MFGRHRQKIRGFSKSPLFNRFRVQNNPEGDVGVGGQDKEQLPASENDDAGIGL